MRQPREGGAAPRPAQGVVVAPRLRRVDVTRTYLALDTPAQLRPYFGMSPHAVRLHRPERMPPHVYRRLYRDVGKAHYWHDRLDWSDERIADHLADPRIAVWVMGALSDPRGYFELRRHDDSSVEIAYFGLLPEFIGQKLGGWMLTFAVEQAWAMGAKRVWLHTCTLDSPHALPNYKARGFVEFKTDRLEVEIEGDAVKSEPIVAP